jgi:hypothetical protein
LVAELFALLAEPERKGDAASCRPPDKIVSSEASFGLRLCSAAGVFVQSLRQTWKSSEDEKFRARFGAVLLLEESYQRLEARALFFDALPRNGRFARLTNRPFLHHAPRSVPESFCLWFVIGITRRGIERKDLAVLRGYCSLCAEREIERPFSNVTSYWWRSFAPFQASDP